MKLGEFFKQSKPVFSFEFFPPKTDDGVAKLMAHVQDLAALGPSYVSMTYGAGGSTRDRTLQLVEKIKNDVGIETVCHLACGGHTRSEMKTILSTLRDQGIENVLALRGDPPRGEKSFPVIENGFKYAAELVKLIKSNYDFGIGVAGYPEKHTEAPTLESDLQHLKEKVDCGADVIITQLFFDNKDYFSFVERLRTLGVTVPIVPGIMPIKDVDQIKRFTTMCGAKIPAELLQILEPIKEDKEKVVQAGIDYALKQSQELIEKGAPGIHYYTLNQSKSTHIIFERLAASFPLARES